MILDFFIPSLKHLQQVKVSLRNSVIGVRATLLFLLTKGMQGSLVEHSALGYTYYGLDSPLGYVYIRVFAFSFFVIVLTTTFAFISTCFAVLRAGMFSFEG